MVQINSVGYMLCLRIFVCLFVCYYVKYLTYIISDNSTRTSKTIVYFKSVLAISVGGIDFILIVEGEELAKHSRCYQFSAYTRIDGMGVG